MHGSESPSAWVRRWSHLVPPGAAVLDVACVLGRHMRWFRDQGHPVTGIDRAPEAVAAAQDLGAALQADLEGAPWPLPGRTFGGVVVANYLWRPLFPALRASVAAGGVLICETFASGNETVGRPARPEFLLQPGELLALCEGLRVVAFEDGFVDAPPRFVQRIAAVRVSGPAPARYLLE
jgi:hypothetical protein